MNECTIHFEKYKVDVQSIFQVCSIQLFEIISQPLMNTQKTWVKESPFGIWFLNTDIWLNHVLNRALNDLETLIPGNHTPHYPTVLDIGCGRGNSFSLLDSRFSPKSICGIEIDASLLQNAAARGRQCHAEVNVTMGNAENMPYPDNSFDMLFCHQSLHHIINHQRAMQEFYRVLKPGGVLLMAESCKKFIHSWSIRLLFRHPMAVQKTSDQYLELVQKNGFTVLPESISKPYLWWSRWDLGALEWLGLPLPKEREETLLNLVGSKPGKADDSFKGKYHN